MDVEAPHFGAKDWVWRTDTVIVYRRRARQQPLFPALTGDPMRRFLLAVPFLIACGGAETPPADSAAAAGAPAALTEADVAGTWTGTAMMEGTDSIIAHWTQVCAAGTCRGTSQEEPSDTVVSTYTLQADSSVGITQPYASKSMGGIMVIDQWVARISGNQVTGTGMFTLASKPDSVLARYRVVGTKSP
jgi:hypothetical protein